MATLATQRAKSSTNEKPTTPGSLREVRSQGKPLPRKRERGTGRVRESPLTRAETSPWTRPGLRLLSCWRLSVDKCEGQNLQGGPHTSESVTSRSSTRSEKSGPASIWNTPEHSVLLNKGCPQEKLVNERLPCWGFIRAQLTGGREITNSCALQLDCAIVGEGRAEKSPEVRVWRRRLPNGLCEHFVYPTPYCTLLKVHLQQVPCFGFCVSVVLPPVQAGPQTTSFHSMSFRYNVEDKTQELNSCYINEPMVKLVSL